MKKRLSILLLMLPMMLVASISPQKLFPTVLSSSMEIKLNQTIALKKTTIVTASELLGKENCIVSDYKRKKRNNHKTYGGEICELDSSPLPLLAEFTFVPTTNNNTLSVKKRQTFTNTNLPSLIVDRDEAKLVFKAPLDSNGKRVQHIGKIVDRAYNSNYTFHEGDYYIDSIDIESSHPKKNDTFFLKTKGKVRIFLNNDSQIIKRADDYKKRGYIELNYKRKSDKLLIFSKKNLLIDASRRLKMKGFIYGYSDVTLISNINATFIGAVTAQGSLTLGKEDAKHWKQEKSGEYIYDEEALGKIDLDFSTDIAKDSTPPIITLNGDTNITIMQGDTYVEYGASAIDESDGDINVTINGEVDTSTVGEYNINYIAKDIAGNEAIATRTVNVIAPTLTSISLESNVSTLTIGDKANLIVVATYSNNSTQELDRDIEWLITPTDSIEMSGNILTAKKESTVTIQAKLGTQYSNIINLTIATIINGYILPPEPDPAINNATLLGIDSNDNGVRDDVERYIIHRYANDLEYPKTKTALALQYAWASQKILENPTMDSKKYIDDALDCESYWIDTKTKNMSGFEYIQYSVKHGVFNDPETKDKIYNTRERIEQKFSFNSALSGNIFDGRDENIENCQINIDKLGE